MILVVDNYDSFTYNLVQLLLSLGREVEVKRNDALSVEGVLALEPEAIVLSPGPGRPEDAGICVELLQSGTAVPILGVCLGHQALGLACGGTIEFAPVLMHGKTSQVTHQDRGIFEGLPNPFEATRYHSLRVADGGFPSCLEVLARSEDETIMGMAHRELPYWGVQFHPESILTSAGGRIMERFLELAARARGVVGALGR
ncbi:MAG TPA: aminodeoxychorismate/anthranilate synthase component II [Thermoanaerobaculia bacterium]|jgi:anthranilate synthase/aminodeoxychorismate synthase-like glutamine amidotransferase|nr:aminodeoxychorismate/anthranilate synthase component II [Thermoanaerobaculia bacterium]